MHQLYLIDVSKHKGPAASHCCFMSRGASCITLLYQSIRDLLYLIAVSGHKGPVVSHCCARAQGTSCITLLCQGIRDLLYWIAVPVEHKD